MNASVRAPREVREAKGKAFADLWNAGTPIGIMAQRLGYKNEHTVYYMASYFRRQGFDLSQRPKSRAPFVARARTVKPGKLCPYYALSEGYQPAKIMDATGKVVAVLDPKTRERRPV